MQELSKNQKEASNFMQEVSKHLSDLSDKVNAFLHKANKADLNPQIDFEDALSRFREHDTKMVDTFIEGYVMENMEKGRYDANSVIEIVKDLRAFLYNAKRKELL